MRKLFTLAATGLTLFAAACAHPVDTAGVPAFGEAVRTMQRVQAVPSEPSAAPPEGSAAAGALAQERYKAGQTQPLQSPATSSVNPSTR
jgi:hypothetical protein